MQTSRVKGKQVQILYDLVTVMKEYAATYATDIYIGKAAVYVDFSVRKPAVCLYGSYAPNHEVLIVHYKAIINCYMFYYERLYIIVLLSVPSFISERGFFNISDFKKYLLI